MDLSRFDESPHFDETERLALRLAVALSVTPSEVSDDLFAALRNRFSEPELVDLSSAICWENYRARFNRTFAIGSEGFFEGDVCIVPNKP